MRASTWLIPLVVVLCGATYALAEGPGPGLRPPVAVAPVDGGVAPRNAIPPGQEALVMKMLGGAPGGCKLQSVAIEKTTLQASYGCKGETARVVLHHVDEPVNAIGRTVKFALHVEPAALATSPFATALIAQVKAHEGEFKWTALQADATPAPPPTANNPAPARPEGLKVAPKPPEIAYLCPLDKNGHPGTQWNCMVPIPGGTFVMGAQAKERFGKNFDKEARPDEGPPHKVTLKPYFIHQTEVETGMFQRCVDWGGCDAKEWTVSEKGSSKSGWSLPVTNVTWQGAAQYCRWVGGRLPTEAEWERAARGPKALRYPWGDEKATCPLVVMTDEKGSGCGRGGPGEVFAMQNAEKQRYLYHMAGNAWEWVADWYDANAYSQSPGDNPKGPAAGTRRVQRGGGWMSRDATELRGAARASLEPTERFDDLGFRCAADSVPEYHP